MDAPKWLDAHDEPFDPSPAIDAWIAGDGNRASAELWQRLYHQGTVGSASYAAVPDLVRLLTSCSAPDWNAYALMASIEEARIGGEAPAISDDLHGPYFWAWEMILPAALEHMKSATDDALVRSLIAVIAHAKKQHSIATIALYTEDERQEMLGMDP